MQANPVRPRTVRTSSAVRDRFAVIASLALAFAGSNAQAGLATVYEFLGRPSGGSEPQTDLVLNGEYFYGTTVSGGANDFGTVYRVRPDGSGYQLLYSFENSGPNTAAGPQGSIAISGNTIYGIANGGGPAAAGRIYKVGTDGTGFQILHNFAGGLANEGADPFGGLILDGTTLYGNTSRGGTAFNRGSVWKMNVDGSAYTQLKAFDFATTGGQPDGRLLKIGSTLYGTTTVGLNTSINGTAYKVNTDGSGFSILHQFGGGTTDGSSIVAGLISDGTRLYGASTHGGMFNGGTVFSMNLDGSGYQLLHSFDTLNGTGPEGELTLIGSILYGSTRGGGSGGLGTVFKLDTSGANFMTLGDMTEISGVFPETALVPVGDTLYGTTRFGGVGGLVYSLDLAPACNLVGDANDDHSVGAADYAIWAAQFGQSGANLSADFDDNGSVGAGDYTLWAANFGNTCSPAASVPEPGSAPLLLLGFVMFALRLGRQTRGSSKTFLV